MNFSLNDIKLINISLIMFYFSGSFSFSVLSGKVMFRDVHLITEDFSIRVEYGWLIFRWWRPYVYKELTEGKSIR